MHTLCGTDARPSRVQHFQRIASHRLCCDFIPGKSDCADHNIQIRQIPHGVPDEVIAYLLSRTHIARLRSTAITWLELQTAARPLEIH